QVWREQQATRRLIEPARKTDADAFDLLLAASGHDALDGIHQAVAGALGIGGRGHHLLRSELAVGVGERDGGLRRPDIDADDHALIVEAKKSGTTSTRQAAGGTLDDPILLDQLLYDQRDGAALEAGEPRQIGARDRMARAHQVEDDAPVDIAHYLAGGRLHFLGFDAG